MKLRREHWFVFQFLAVAGSLYALSYFPYSEAGTPHQLRQRFFELTAHGSGFWIRLFDDGATVSGSVINGSFPLQIVLGCEGLDAVSLCSAAVIAFPASLRFRLLGLLGCNAFILVVNQLRIAGLYFAGKHSLELFRFLHEEAFAIISVLVSVGAFCLWLGLWNRVSERDPLRPVEATA